MKNKKIVITGALGMIGSALAEKYSADNTIIGIDIKDTKNELFDELYVHDCTQFFGLHGIIMSEEPDIIFHCASPVGVEEVLNNDRATQRAMKINMNIYDICESLKCELIFFSSSELYGNRMNISILDDTFLPPSINNKRGGYAAQKAVSEFIFNEGDFKNLNIRLFNITGKTQSTTKGVIPLLINKLIIGEEITINHDIRTFLDIDDFIEQFDEIIKDYKSNDLKLIGDHSASNTIKIVDLLDLIVMRLDYHQIQYNKKSYVKRNVLNDSGNYSIRSLMKTSDKINKSIENIIDDIIDRYR